MSAVANSVAKAFADGRIGAPADLRIDRDPGVTLRAVATMLRLDLRCENPPPTNGGGATWGQVATVLAPHGLAISSGDTKSMDAN
jgi:hypothetical protein